MTRKLSHDGNDVVRHNQQITTFYASGRFGPRVREDADGFKLECGYYAQIADGSIFGPFAVRAFALDKGRLEQRYWNAKNTYSMRAFTARSAFLWSGQTDPTVIKKIMRG
jgi:hypothetical protein